MTAPLGRGGGWRCAFGLWLGAAALLALAGCKASPIEAGEACTRSSECSAGLVCVEGECSKDLAALANQGTVPMLMPEEMMEPEANADAAAAMGMDAGMPMGAAGSGAAGQVAALDDAGTDAAVATDGGP